MVVYEGSGSWLEYLEFDGKVYWTVNDEIPQWHLPNSDRVRDDLRECLLPSDSSYRPDLKALIEKDMLKAEKEKNELEVVQRRDKHLRQECEKQRAKK